MKLRKLAYSLKNSTTLLLPKWFSILEDLEISKRMMPRDVTTRWNSTFDMLDFALKYQKPLQIITSNLDLNLRQYELSREEWKTAKQLCDVLKVRSMHFFIKIRLTNFRFLKMRLCFSRNQSRILTASYQLWTILTNS
jgi:hypothetical protein